MAAPARVSANQQYAPGTIFHGKTVPSAAPSVHEAGG
jgi:hypothetical protein